jgi:chorismate dehydratase
LSLSNAVNDQPIGRTSCRLAGDFDSIGIQQLFEREESISTTSVAKPRLAASGYLNSAPLIWSFTQGSRRNDVDYVDAVPARCADLLAAGAADFALVPVIEYQRIESATLVPDVCVAARETVRSVVLATKLKNLKDVRTVALDESSRTSAALVKIIFHEFLGMEPEFISSSPNLRSMLEKSDAALMIGDPAMTFDREGLNVFDLANLWRHYTGHGFVFAMWMVGGNVPQSSLIDFAAACEEGMAKRPAIIDYYQPLLGLSREELRTYLYENICYFLDSDLRAGLELYYKLAHKHRLIPALKPLNL